MSFPYTPWPEDLPEDLPPPAPPPALCCSRSGRLPLYIALALLAALCGSTGPSWFRLMGPSASGLTKAFWRMSLTAVLQAPLALLLEGRSGCGSSSAFAAWCRMALFTAAPVGAAMGLHFAAVASATTSTSFLHVMATVNLAPLFFFAFSLLRHAASRAPPAARACPAFLHPTRAPAPHALEGAGAVMAFGGVVALVSLDRGASVVAADLPASPGGDAVGLAASLFMALYLAGASRRGSTRLISWMLPLHASAAVVTGVLSLAAGGSFDAGPNGLFRIWLMGDEMSAALGAALVPSMVCHSLANWLAVESRLTPFLVSVFLTLQPLTGNVFAWLIGLQGLPSSVGYACAPLIVAGTVLATVGLQKQRAKAAAAAVAAKAAGAAAAEVEKAARAGESGA